MTFDKMLFSWVQDEICKCGIVGSVVECSPATRAARVRFPDDAVFFVRFEKYFIRKLDKTVEAC